MKSAALNILRALGIEDRLRESYWRARLWRARIDLRVGGVRRRFRAFDYRTRGKLLRLGGERKQLEGFLAMIEPGDVVWDVGSNMGLYSLFASHFAGTIGTICAFEPEPLAFKRLKINCKLNSATNITPVRVALSDQVGGAVIYSSNRDLGKSTLRQSELITTPSLIEVTTGEHIVAQGVAPAPNVLKLDVEGAEYGALNGMRSLLADNRCRFALIEVHPDDLARFGHSAEKVRALLEECGFTIRSEVQRGSEAHWSAFKQIAGTHGPYTRE